MRKRGNISRYTAEELAAKEARGEDKTDWAAVAAKTEEVRRSRVFGQVPGRNKLKAGSRLLVSSFPEIKFILSCCGCCEACGQPPTCGQGGGNASRFPRLVHRDRAGAVRRGSAQPTVDKFTAPPRHGVRRPVPW